MVLTLEQPLKSLPLLFRSQSLRMPSSADNSMISLRASPRPMIGYGNVETRVIETNYPVANSLASIASNEESGHLYLSGRHTSPELSREDITIEETNHESEDKRYLGLKLFALLRRRGLFSTLRAVRFLQYASCMKKERQQLVNSIIDLIYLYNSLTKYSHDCNNYNASMI